MRTSRFTDTQIIGMIKEQEITTGVASTAVIINGITAVLLIVSGGCSASTSLSGALPRQKYS